MTVLLNQSNLGFAKGNNVVMKCAKDILNADFVYCINFFSNIGKWRIWTVFVFSELLFIIEICFTYKKSVLNDSSLFIIFLELIPLIVMLVLKYRMTIKLQYNKFRKLNTSIYFSYCFV